MLSYSCRWCLCAQHSSPTVLKGWKAIVINISTAISFHGHKIMIPQASKKISRALSLQIVCFIDKEATWAAILLKCWISIDRRSEKTQPVCYLLIHVHIGSGRVWSTWSHIGLLDQVFQRPRVQQSWPLWWQSGSVLHIFFLFRSRQQHPPLIRCGMIPQGSWQQQRSKQSIYHPHRSLSLNEYIIILPLVSATPLVSSWSR